MPHDDTSLDVESSKSVKRPRLAPKVADGFAKSNDARRPITNAKFVSGFGRPSKTGHRNASNVRSLVQRPDFGSTAGPKLSTKLRVLQPPGLVSNASTSTSDSTAGPSRIQSKDLEPDGTKRLKLTALRPVLLASNATSDTSSDTPSTNDLSRSISNMLRHPPAVSSPSKIVSLKPLPAPPAPLIAQYERQMVQLDTSAMKTISTTRVALATDLSTESGPLELLSIFLKQNGTAYVDPITKELRRGLEQSPETNKGKGKGKYIRGGLAESFSRRFAQISTDQKLWEEQMSRTFADGKRIKPDLRVKILKVLCRSPERLPGKPHVPPVTLVRCLVIDSHVAEVGKGEVTVLFRHSAHGQTHPQYQVEQNAEIHVWRPWTCLQISDVDVHAVHVDASDLALTAPGPVWMCCRYLTLCS